MKTRHDSKVEGIRMSPAAQDQCVWMKTGLMNFKSCENAFNCPSCAFDKAIGSGLGERPTGLAGWTEVMRDRPYFQKECRHMLTGRVQFKLCAHNYECKDCQYDQFLYEEELSVQGPAVQVKACEFYLNAA